VTLVANLNDFGIRAPVARKEVRDERDGFLRGGKTDAERRAFGKSFEAFERERKMRAPFVVGDGVDFVDDDGVDGFEDFPAAVRGKKNVEGLRSSDQDMRRMLEHGAALGHEGVAGAYGGANLGHEEATLHSEALDFAEGNFEIGLDVVAEGF